jgi:hypothetical protein
MMSPAGTSVSSSMSRGYEQDLIGRAFVWMKGGEICQDTTHGLTVKDGQFPKENWGFFKQKRARTLGKLSNSSLLHN